LWAGRRGGGFDGCQSKGQSSASGILAWGWFTAYTRCARFSGEFNDSNAVGWYFHGI
jgi:hypothetical protein